MLNYPFDIQDQHQHENFLRNQNIVKKKSPLNSKDVYYLVKKTTLQDYLNKHSSATKENSTAVNEVTNTMLKNWLPCFKKMSIFLIHLTSLPVI